MATHPQRLARLQAALKEQGLAGAVISNSRDVYYYTGVALPAWLLVRHDDYRLSLRRGLEALAYLDSTCTLDEGCLVAEGRLERACSLLFSGPGQGEKIGAELDLIPMATGLELMKALGGRQLADVTPLVMAQRVVKDQGEIASLEKACAAVQAGHRAGLAALRPGLSELELAVAIESAQRLAGHLGTYFLRQFDVLMGGGPVASGPNLGRITGTVFTLTGVGLHSSLPGGPSLRALQPGDLAETDIPACVEGYHADQSRMYGLDPLPEGTDEVYAGLRAISDRLLAELRPGLTCAQACQLADQAAQDLGLEKSFQRFPNGSKAHYIGHGVGLELNEPPVLAAKSQTPLQENMTLALELHMLHPQGLLMKLEDTFVLTAQGGRNLTPQGRRVNRPGDDPQA